MTTNLKRTWKALLIVSGIVTTSWCLSGAGRISQAPLNSERLQVYSDFIESMDKTRFKFVLNKTFPLDLSGIAKDAICLQGIQLEDTKEAERGFTHTLPSDVLGKQSIQLIDEQREIALLKERDKNAAAGISPELDSSGMTKDPGILALSEINFDKNHHFAVLKYAFLCGSRCNSAAILVLEKVGSNWTADGRRPCSVAVNRDRPLP